MRRLKKLWLKLRCWDYSVCFRHATPMVNTYNHYTGGMSTHCPSCWVVSRDLPLDGQMRLVNEVLEFWKERDDAALDFLCERDIENARKQG